MDKFDMIVELMVDNGVTTKFSKNIFEKLISEKPIIELDFTEHDKPFKDKIKSLQEENRKLHNQLIKTKKDYQLEVERLKQRIAELERGLEKKECIKTMRIEFHADNGEMMTPLEVANSLINQNTFKVDELRELSEFLQVYCNHHEDRDIEPNIMLF